MYQRQGWDSIIHCLLHSFTSRHFIHRKCVRPFGKGEEVRSLVSFLICLFACLLVCLFIGQLFSTAHPATRALNWRWLALDIVYVHVLLHVCFLVLFLFLFDKWVFTSKMLAMWIPLTDTHPPWHLTAMDPNLVAPVTAPASAKYEMDFKPTVCYGNFLFAYVG